MAASEAAITNVFLPGDGNYKCFRIPALTFDPSSSTLYAFAEGRKNSCNDHGFVDLVLKTSRDRGATWGPLSTIYSASNATHFTTVGNPAPVLLAPNSLLLPFCEDNQRVGFLRSTDGGAHWGAPTFLPPSVLPRGLTWVATGPPGSLRLPSGRLVVPVDAQAPDLPYSSGALLSDDAGATWTLSALVQGGNEAQAVALPWRGAGALHLSMRAAAGGARLAASSEDGGATWSAPWHTIAETACEGSVAALPRHAGGPKLLMSSAFAPTRANLTVHQSADDGKTWTPALRVYAGSSAYSSLAALDEVGAVGLLFEADAYTRIAFTSLAL